MAKAKNTENPNAAPIFYVGGVKGGIGKTTLSVALADWLHANQKSVCFVDLDPHNADGTQYFDGVLPKDHLRFIDVAAGDLDRDVALAVGLADLGAIDTETAIVLNSGAATIDARVKNADGSTPSVFEMLQSLGRPFLHVVPIDHDQGTIVLLESIFANEPDIAGRTAAVLNGRNGPSSSFLNFNGSDAESSIKSAGGVIGYMPKIQDRYANIIRERHIPMRRLLDDAALTLGDRVFLKTDQKRWDKLFEMLWQKAVA